MKKHVIIATGLAVLSTSAYASKARMTALGQDANYGSSYIQDSRNIFRNAAHTNNFTNYVVTEWGDNDGAEGGFFRSMGDFNYGIYLGSGINGELVDGQNPAHGNEKENPIDLFFGGDTGAIQWGANLHWASSKTENVGDDDEHSALGLGLGMVMGDIGAYFNYRFKDDHETGNNTVERSMMLVGASYAIGDLTLFANYMKEDVEQQDLGVKVDAETKTTSTIALGVGHIHEVSSTARIFTDVQLQLRKDEVDVAGSDDTKTNTLPVTFGFEADANSWLTLRGSVSQTVLINTTETGSNTKRSLGNTTAVAAGATLNFGNLKVDGVISTSTLSDGNANPDADKLSLGDDVMSQVSVSYWF